MVAGLEYLCLLQDISGAFKSPKLRPRFHAIVNSEPQGGTWSSMNARAIFSISHASRQRRPSRPPAATWGGFRLHTRPQPWFSPLLPTPSSQMISQLPSNIRVGLQSFARPGVRPKSHVGEYFHFGLSISNIKTQFAHFIHNFDLRVGYGCPLKKFEVLLFSRKMNPNRKIRDSLRTIRAELNPNVIYMDRINPVALIPAFPQHFPSFFCGFFDLESSSYPQNRTEINSSVMS